MKKLISVLAVLCLLCTAVAALAEEAQPAHAITDYPGVYFGADIHQALETFNVHWKGTGHYSYSLEQQQRETRTLADGTEVFVITLPGVPDEKGIAMQMTAKLYFIDEKLVAAVQEIPVPEGVDPSMYKETMKNFGGSYSTLDTTKIGTAMELLGEEVHLEDGQDVWLYDIALSAAGEENKAPAVINAMLTAKIADNTLYLAEFTYQKAAEKKAAAQDLAEVEGFDKLTAEEQTAVEQYAEFLQKQQNEILKQFVDFLLSKHQE